MNKHALFENTACIVSFGATLRTAMVEFALNESQWFAASCRICDKATILGNIDTEREVAPHHFWGVNRESCPPAEASSTPEPVNY